MKKIIWVVTLFLTVLSVSGQSLYSNTFGNKNNTPVIFIHGGPAGNSVQFEATTAQKLADKGFYVIVYDRRGEGRSADENAKITYNEAFEDLNGIYKKYHLKRANLIGFSFGGLVTTLYAEKYPEKINAIILTSALVSHQATYDHILDSVKKIYTKNKDSIKLSRVLYVANLNKNAAAYRGGCFSLAAENGFFKVAAPDEEAKNIYKAYEASAAYKNDIRNKKAPEIFYTNEKLTNIDTKPILAHLKQQHINIYAMYGKQDGIFSALQIDSLRNITGEKNFKYLDNCSHYLYADQQTAFLNNVVIWLK